MPTKNKSFDYSVYVFLAIAVIIVAAIVLPAPSSRSEKVIENTIGSSIQDTPAIYKTAEEVKNTVVEIQKTSDKATLYELRKKLKSQSAIILNAGKDSLTAINLLLTDKRPEVRMRGVSILGKSKEIWATEKLCNVVENSTDETMTISSLMYLSQIIMPSSEVNRENVRHICSNALLAALSSESEQVRKSGSRLLWKLFKNDYGYQPTLPIEQREKSIAAIKNRLNGQEN